MTPDDDGVRWCWCGAPARGQVAEVAGVPAHYCRQCEQHCQLTAYLRAKGRA